MDQTDSEQLVVGQDARDRKRRLIKWLTIGLAVFIVIAISVAIAYPLIKRPPPTRFEVPTTLAIDDKRVHLVFGEGEGNMATEAIIEVSYVVDRVTVHMNKTIVSDRADYDNKDKVYDPVVKFDTIRSDTGTLVRYTVGSKYHPEDSAHFKLTVLIPPFFDGDLTIDGTTLDIKTWRLGAAYLRLLHLSTDVGNITFHNGSRIDPGYGIYQPTIRTKALYANIRERGSIHFSAPMLAQEYPHDFHAHIETREGDITFETVTNMFNAMPYGKEPWDPNDMTDTLRYFDLVAHKGNIHFDIRFDGVVRGPWYLGMTRVDAKAEAGSVQGRMEVGWLVNVFIDLQATQGCDLRLSDNYEGPLTVISSTGNATVVPTPNNTHIYTDLRPQQCGLKHIFKSNDGELLGIGTLSIKTTHGDAGLYFEDFNY